MSDETPGAGHNAQPPREGSAPRPSIRFPQVAGGQYYITQSQPRAIPALSQLPIAGASNNATSAHTVSASGGTLSTVPRIITISPSSSRALQQQQQSGGTSSAVSPANRPSLVNRSIVSALTGRPHPTVRTQLFPANAAVQHQVHAVVGNAAIVDTAPPSPSTTSHQTQLPYFQHQAMIHQHQTSISNTSRSSPPKRTLSHQQLQTTTPSQSAAIGSNVAKRQRVMNHRIVKSKLLREKYNEHILEQYFAAAGGQILDLHQFAKRPRTQQYVAYMREHAIDPKEYDVERVTQGTTAAQSPLHPPTISSPSISSPIPTPPITILNPITSTPLITLTPAQPSVIPIPTSAPTLSTTPLSTIATTITLAAPPSATPISSLPGSTSSSINLSLQVGVHVSPDGSAGSSGLNKDGVGVIGGTGTNSLGNGRTSTPQQSQPASQQASTSQASTSGGNQQEQIVEKAKQEAYVVQRISDLQKEGLWPEKRLPKIQELPRAKAHWDYLLEEMLWLAADFAQERKWKKAAAKKCARMVQKYFQDKAVAAQKAEKAQEQHLRRVAAFCAKEIRNFWSNVEKLVEYKQNTRLEEKRKKALDQHLSFIVDQTEKYSQLLAEGMNKPTTDASAVPPSTASSNPVSRVNSDDEFQPIDENSTDDEETIAQEEAAADETDDKKDEVEALQRESEMDFEAFLSELPKDYLQNRDKIRLSDADEEQENEEDATSEESSKKPETRSSSSSSNQLNERGKSKKDTDFTADSDSADDEDTICEQEANENPNEHKQELHDLDVESHLTIDELRAKYSDLPDVPPSGSDDDSSEENDSDADEHSSGHEDSDDVSKQDESDSDVDVTSDGDSGNSDSDEAKEEDKEEVGLKSLLEDDDGRDDDDLINDAAAIAESIQPKGNTLSSTSVVTKIPFLLKYTLREYQHIGLDWLVTMCERKLNGILADEMGLGKTIQTIALLAHLACEKGNWGPHLIVVPTSVMLNWEMECKKWCPGFKILTYYGSQKERKQKRTGWTKANAFHVCITSYKLVIQDHQSFRRKKWKYLILDEAQNIKNFKSQRWQLLLNFQTQQRLLLTGTPLQNNLMELWSLMHFLMPNVFQSHREFKEWFSNPVTGMIEGNNEYNENIIKRLHKVLRPFLLRRLKCEVEKQMPKKYEHVVMCRLSKRQRFLYDDYMSRAKTRETLATGNLLSVINVLMQLRKVCNHPNLFEVRPTISPFHCEGIVQHFPSLIYAMLEPSFKYAIDLATSNYNIARLEPTYSAYQCYRLQQYQTPRRLIEEVCRANEPSTSPSSAISGEGNIGNIRRPSSRLLDTEPYLPPCKLALQVHQQLHKIKSEPTDSSEVVVGKRETNTRLEPIKVQSVKLNAPSVGSSNSRTFKPDPLAAHGYAQVVETSSGKHILLQSTSTATTANTSKTTTVLSPSGQKVTILPKTCTAAQLSTKATLKVEMSTLPTPLLSDSDDTTRLNVDQIEIDVRKSVGTRFIDKLYSNQPHASPSVSGTTMASRGSSKDSLDVRWRNESASYQMDRRNSCGSERGNRSMRSSSYRSSDAKSHSSDHHHSHHHHATSAHRHHSSNRHHYSSSSTNQHTDVRMKIDMIHRVNTNRCRATPIYGTDLLEATRMIDLPSMSMKNGTWKGVGSYNGMLGYVRGDEEEVYRWYQGMDESLSAQTGSRGMECTDGLREMVGTGYVGRIGQMTEVFNRFIVYVPAAHAPEPELQVWHPPVSKYWSEKRDKRFMVTELFEPTAPLHSIASAMVTQFPHPRLIQYDCGKLQTLDRLLRKLKMGGHRALIFTQMTKMLDVLEAFLNFHGHIYLRLDGTTRVDQRQMLMERFNGDKRIFVFILSTRSGGVGVNLTGADTVIFYDSDWNPTMDAQAQDRCHRIGQTRDVHIYRLVSERTIEENILKKANQKRLLGDLAIEGGNFTTAYFKSTTIQDLFSVDQSSTSTASSRMSDLIQRQQQSQDIDPITTTIIEDIHPEMSTTEVPAATPGEKTAIGALESALAAAEDDQDVIAARTAKAEAVADLAEFDENIPLEEVLKERDGVAGRDQAIEISKAEMEVENIVKQLTPIERYAMKFIEETEAAWSQAQLEAAEREIETQKREWEENRLKAMREEAERRSKELEEEQRDQLTFPREDAINQVSNNAKKGKINAQAAKKIGVGRNNSKLSNISQEKVVSPQRMIVKTPVKQSSSCKKLVRTVSGISRRRIVRRIIVNSNIDKKATKKLTETEEEIKNYVSVTESVTEGEDTKKSVKKTSVVIEEESRKPFKKIDDDSKRIKKSSISEDSKTTTKKDDNKKPIIKKNVSSNEDDKRRTGKRISFSEDDKKLIKKSNADQDIDCKKSNKKISQLEDNSKKPIQKSATFDVNNKKINKKCVVGENSHGNTKKLIKKPLVDEYVRRSTRKLHIIDDDPIVSNPKPPIIQDENSTSSIFTAPTEEDSNHSSSMSYDHQSYDSSASDVSADVRSNAFLFKGKQNRISPRTRSRGTVPIDLWSLDVSPILADKVVISGKTSNNSESDDNVNEDDTEVVDTEIVERLKEIRKKYNIKIKDNNLKDRDALQLRRGRSRNSVLQPVPEASSKENRIDGGHDEERTLENSVDSDSDKSVDDFANLIGTNVSCMVTQNTTNDTGDDDFYSLIGTNANCAIINLKNESSVNPTQNGSNTEEVQNDISSELKDSEKNISSSSIRHRHGIRLKKKSPSPKVNRYLAGKSPTGLRRPLIKARISPKSNIIKRSSSCHVVMEDIATSGILNHYVQGNIAISVKRRIPIRNRRRFNHNSSNEKLNTLDDWLNSSASSNTSLDQKLTNLDEITLIPINHTQPHNEIDENEVSVDALNDSSSNHIENNGNDNSNEPPSNSIENPSHGGIILLDN